MKSYIIFYSYKNQGSLSDPLTKIIEASSALEATNILDRQKDNSGNLKMFEVVELEFNIGDLVTFKPYEKAIPAKIKGINNQARFNLTDELDNRVFYELTGAGKKAVCTYTTGISIVESKLFNHYSPIEDSYMGF